MSHNGTRWLAPFLAVAALVGAATLSVGLLYSPPASSLVAGFWIAIGGEILLAAAFIVLSRCQLVLPVRRTITFVGDGAKLEPVPAGVIVPLVDAVVRRIDRELAEAGARLIEGEEKLRQLELLRRDLEETKAHLESKVQDLRSIYEVSAAIAGSLDTEELFRILPERVMRTLGLNDFCLMLYDQETRFLVCRASASSGEAVKPGTAFPAEGIAGKVFTDGEAVYVPDVRTRSEFLYYGGTRPDVRSFMCVPLTSKGKAIGVLNVNHPEPDAFDAESLATLTVLAGYVATAIENAELFQFVKTLAEKDSLTLLYNHGAFHERLSVELERADRYQRDLSVIMMDLDGFKTINDTYGHPVGDRILLMTAGVLCAHLRKSDIAARYGGDEFAVILPETALPAAATIAERISAGLSQVRLDTEKGDVIMFTASIGYVTCSPDSRRRNELLAVADELMFESKRKGRGGVRGLQI